MDKTYFARNDGHALRWKWDFRGEIVIFRLRGDYNFILLNQPAAILWALSDGSRSLSEIASTLSGFYGIMDGARWEKILNRTARDLVRRGLFRRVVLTRPSSLKPFEILSFLEKEKSFCLPRIAESDKEGFIFSQGTRPGRPPQVYLVLTHRCNFNCRHCYEKSHAEENPLTTGQAKRFIDEVAAAGVFCVVFTGGEPFLRDDIYELIGYAAEKGLYIRVNTNGSFLNQDAISRLLSYRGKVVFSVSLDGASGVTHDFNRGDGAFDSALSAIRGLIRNKLDVFVDCTVNRKNCRELAKVYRLCGRLGVNALNIGGFNPLGIGARQKKPLFLSAIPYRFFFYLFRLEVFLFNLFGGPGHTRLITYLNKRCLAGTLYCAIEVTGRISCCELMDYPAGDLFETGIVEAWHSSRMLRALDANRFGIPCGICLFRYTCNGKCRAYVLEQAGDIRGGNLSCLRGKLFRKLSAVFPFSLLLEAAGRILDRKYAAALKHYAPYKIKEIEKNLSS
ncbi:MAG: radical SAM protein [Candidatus Omnitrophica bacterium]|jgi:radical SAM protein with 4Fe4S-binding SPASM domain|nr:radical SAM protein [Candidatus Omnitrophota bacterium]MDD3275050.1 radical SAM protein [Candidatus Omnitrophota bacterium]